MNSKQSKECPNCHRWISCMKGRFMKHAQKCLPKPDEPISSEMSTFDLLIHFYLLQMTNIHQMLTIPTVICMTTFLLSTE